MLNMLKDRKAQSTPLVLAIFTFWFVLAFLLTAYNSSAETEKITPLGLNETSYSASLTASDVEPSTEAGFWTATTNIGKVFLWLLQFFLNFLGLVTLYFPSFESVMATSIIFSILLLLKLASWIIVIMAIKNSS